MKLILPLGPLNLCLLPARLLPGEKGEETSQGGDAPFGDTTLSSRLHPCESCGDATELSIKIGMFYTRGRKQSFFLSSPAIAIARSSLLFSLSPTLAAASPFPAWELLPHWVSKSFMSKLRHSVQTRVCRKRKLWLTLIKFALLFPVGPQI